MTGRRYDLHRTRPDMVPDPPPPSPLGDAVDRTHTGVRMHGSKVVHSVRTRLMVTYRTDCALGLVKLDSLLTAAMVNCPSCRFYRSAQPNGPDRVDMPGGADKGDAQENNSRRDATGNGVLGTADEDRLAACETRPADNGLRAPEVGGGSGGIVGGDFTDEVRTSDPAAGPVPQKVNPRTE